MKLFVKSQCEKKGWLHNFQIIAQSPDGVLERCDKCHKKVFFKVIGGRVNNRKYISHHERQALNPAHRLFRKEYPHVKI